MKTFIYILTLFTLFTLAACAPGGNISTSDADKRTEANIVKPDEDEQEYELIIIDPGFNTWFITNARPIGFYSPQYYEQWNQIYTTAWNEKVDQQVYYNDKNYPFENKISYDPSVDYGVELNYKLYYYFRYIESLYGDRYNFPGIRRGKMTG